MTDPTPPHGSPAAANSALSPSSPDRSAEEIVRAAAKTAGFVGVPGAYLPHLDIGALILLWAEMIRQLAKLYKLKVSWLDSLKMAVAIAGAASAFGGGMKTATWLFGYTGIGSIPAMAANATLNTAVTYTVGRGIAEVFAKEDTDIGSFLASLTRELIKIVPPSATFGSKIFKRGGATTTAS